MWKRLLFVFVVFIVLSACNQNDDQALDAEHYDDDGFGALNLRRENSEQPGLNQNENNGNNDGNLRVGGEGLGEGYVNRTQHPSDTISSDETSVPSNKYPHTKAVKVQEAKYKFITIGPGMNKRETNWQQIGQGSQQQPKQNERRQQEQKQTNEPQPEQGANQAEQSQPEQGANQAEPKQPEQPATQGITAAESKVIELTNAERRKNGLADLQADTSLSNVARKKSNDMQTNGYFSHTSPTYGSPFDMMRDFGVTYQTAGENIAQGQQTPEQVVQSWMNSEGHRKNILSGKFTHIGVGYDEKGHYWTQMFIGK